MSGERHGYDGWLNGQAFCLCGSTFPSMDAFESHVGMTTPVPSEADPGTGERETETLDAVIAEGELSLSLHRTGLLNLSLSDSLDIDCWDAARAVLASDWLASHDAATADRVRQETAEGIAAAIERLPLTVTSPDPIDGRDHIYPRAAEQLRADAARIAREAGR
jgi:hypothetical protein